MIPLVVQVCGLPTNVEFLQRILSNKEFASGQFTTNFIEQNKDQLLAPTTISTDVSMALALVSHKQLPGLFCAGKNFELASSCYVYV